MENPKFVLKKTKDKQFHFTLQAENGETILQSETYTEKHNAKAGIKSVVYSILNMLGYKFTADEEMIKIEDLT